MRRRFRGHSMADAGAYRSRDEVQEWQRRDPIALYAARLEEEGVFDSELREEIDSSVEQEIERAVKFALESPSPDVENLYDNVYTPQDWE
ncbi:MAG: thiamine pyrophosphate-dependent enzyme [Chloroflexia bacterium]